MAWRPGIVALGLAVAATGRPRDVEACTPPSEAATVRAVLPEDGASGVPRNARVLVSYDNRPVESLLTLRAQGGLDIATTWVDDWFERGFLLVPTQPLAASTTYEVLDAFTIPCDHPGDGTCVGAPTVIATFTTGDELDTSPPRIAVTSVSSSYTCMADSCPEGEDAVLGGFTIDEREDDFPEEWIRLEYVNADGVAPGGPTTRTLLGQNCDGPGYVRDVDYLAIDADVRVRAVDLAGNVEPSLHTIEVATCAQFAGVCDPPPDAGPGGPGADDPAGDAGCGCRTNDASLGSLALLGVIAMLARARRRR